MKRKIRSLLFVALILSFITLSLTYLFDANRRSTRARLHPINKELNHDFMLSSLNVTSIAQDANKLMWIGTSAGVNVYNGKDYVQFGHDVSDSTALPDDYVNVIFKDKADNMWVGTQNGLVRYEGAGRFKRFNLPERNRNICSIKDATVEKNKHNAVIVSNGSNVYKVSDEGIYKCDKDAKIGLSITENKLEASYIPFLNKPKEMISCFFRDAGGNEWVGYRNGGYQVLSNNMVSFLKANNNALARATKGKDIISLRKVGITLIAGTTLRLFLYNPASNRLGEAMYSQFFHLSTDGSVPELVDIIPISPERVCLVSTEEVVMCRFNAENVSFSDCRTLHRCNAQRGERLGMAAKLGQHVYVTAENGVLLSIDCYKESVERIQVALPFYDSETMLTSLQCGDLLLFMKNMRLATYSPTKHEVRSVVYDTPSFKVENIDPAFAMEDSRGTLWLGTRRYGLYEMNVKTRRLQRSHVVSDVHVQGMVEDMRGQLWITTLKDAVCYNPSDGTIMMNSLVSSSQNEWQRQFFDNAISLTIDSCIVLGSSDGCIFIPSSSGNKYLASNKHVERNKLVTYDHKTTLEGGFCIYSLEVKKRSGEQLSLDNKRLDGHSFTFAYDENTLLFRFFYPNYTRRSALLCQCKLEGYDVDWRAPTYENQASYENLPAGRYKFRVRLLSSLSRPPLAERVVEVTIKPAPWACSAAWLLYAAIAFVALFYIDSLYLKIRTNRLLMLNEQKEKEREHHTNEMNMNFFANISHEFRNPLTIIAGPLLSLKSDTTLPTHMRLSLNRVCVSVNRMLRLIDQMLDFNQLETDALRLCISRHDVSSALEEWLAVFEETTRLRGISLRFQRAEACYVVRVDMDKLEKIMSNLLTNALKHTPDGGTILVGLSREEKAAERLVVSVFNTGSSIPTDRLQDVFKRYFQQKNTSSNHTYGWGTGIGLYYVKRLVGLHHGSIEVSNKLDKEGLKGVEFRFTLPTNASAYLPEEYAKEEKSVMQLPVDKDFCTLNVDEDVFPSSHAKQPKKSKPKILIVDDDLDVAQYIRSLFTDAYQVETRYSAEAALHDISNIRPDIVLSDVVMDGMSGYDLCHTLKADLMYSHIPFVLITAKADMQDRISGLRLGALAYVTKPFDPHYLQALVASQLQNVLSLRKRLGENVETAHLEDELSAQDKQFMDELYTLMEKRSAELELNVSTVCRDMLMSQSKFTYKLKELTGDTPGVFFRKYKLNKAAHLLKERNHTMAEVAVMTGFSTAAHFSVAFKKQFGISPSEYC